MKNDRVINLKKRQALKTIVQSQEKTKRRNEENQSNSKELILKNVELYVPYTFEQLCNLNKKKYRDLKIKELKNYFTESLWNLNQSIKLYKELINRTEFWERKSTYDFNFKDWNTLKKANGKLTRYYNEILKINQKIESEET